MDSGEILRGALREVRRAGEPAGAVGENLPTFHEPPVMIAFGKAAVSMAVAACGQIEVSGGVVVCPPGVPVGSLPAGVRVLRADHPLPTERNIDAALAVQAAAASATGVVLALVSGGGSAHLALPAAGLTLARLASVSDALQLAGAPIDDLNAVRKHCEELKGGRLGVACARRVEVLVLSDVIGDRLDVISSGPFAADPTTFADALGVLARWKVSAPEVRAHLARGAAGEIEETPKPGDPRLARVTHRIISSNRVVVSAAERALRGSGVSDILTRHAVIGEAADAGRELADALVRIAGRSAPAAVIFGGETTVRVGGADGRAQRGRGGPSQELALAALIRLHESAPEVARRAAILSYSTDGVDGRSPYAGCLWRGEAFGLDAARAALAGHDSSGFFERVGPSPRGVAITTGPTGTNVNHVAIALLT